MPSDRTRNNRSSRNSSREQVRFDKRAYYIRNAGRYSLPGRFLFPPHYHDAIEVIATPGGVGGSVTAGGREIALTDAHFVAVPPDMIHSFDLRCEQERPFLLLQMDLEWAVHALGVFTGAEQIVKDGLARLVNIRGPRAATLYRSMIRLSTYGQTPNAPHYSSSIEAAARDFEIMAAVLGAIASSTKGHAPPREAQPLKDAIDFIEKNATEGVSLDRVAAACTWSKFHLCREFKARTGWTIRDYCNHARIGRAQALFDQGETNVSAVAYACGFSDPSHFAKVFGRYAGIRPKKYALKRGGKALAR
jgi:AraC-like DNA-binding protein